VIVEGNFDVLSLHARGIKHVVAPLGTAFTVEQARQIRRFTQNLTLFFDPDEAGRRAVRAARDTCRDAGLTARVATLPEGVDPDELARRGGSEQLGRVLDAASPMIEYLIKELLDRRVEANNAATQAQRVQEVVELVASEPDPTVRGLAETYADKLAGGLALGQPEIRTLASLKRHLAEAAGRGGAPAHSVPRVQPPHRARSRDMREQVGLEILGALLDFPELFAEPEAGEAAALLEGDVAAGLAALRQARELGTIDPELVLAKLAAPIHPFALARTAAPKHERLVDAKAELVGNLRKLESLTWSKERSMKVEELQRAERVGDVEQEDTILRRLRDKARERHGL
jgi:DNA primase